MSEISNVKLTQWGKILNLVHFTGMTTAFLAVEGRDLQCSLTGLYDHS